MDRVQSQLLVKEEYISANVTVGEFLSKIEPRLTREMARRLERVLADRLDYPMPD